MHADGNGLKGFELLGSGIARASHLGLEFAIAGGVNVGERGAGGYESLWIRDAFGGAENFEELVALPADTAEETEFLEDKRPGDQGKEEQDRENNARDPARLRKNVKDIADEDCG